MRSVRFTIMGGDHCQNYNGSCIEIQADLPSNVLKFKRFYRPTGRVFERFCHPTGRVLKFKWIYRPTGRVIQAHLPSNGSRIEIQADLHVFKRTILTFEPEEWLRGALLYCREYLLIFHSLWTVVKHLISVNISWSGFRIIGGIRRWF